MTWVMEYALCTIPDPKFMQNCPFVEVSGVHAILYTRHRRLCKMTFL